MARSYKELILAVKDILDNFNEENTSSEIHLQNYLNKLQPVTETDESFITNAFIDCVQFKKALLVIVDAFYAIDGKAMLKSEKNLYLIFSYLYLLAYDHIGLSWFKRCVYSQHNQKMYTFFKFATNEKHIHTWVKDEWNKLYDTNFVQESLYNPLINNLPDLKKVVISLKQKLENKKEQLNDQEISSKKPNTQIEPFQLTQVKPRTIPIPLPIERPKKWKPVPKSNYELPQEKETLERIQSENRQNSKRRLLEANKKKFSCADATMSIKTLEKMDKVVEERDAELRFNESKAHPLPDFGKNKPVVRLNAAAILREGDRYKKMQEEEWSKLVKLESGYGDSEKFDSWQEKVLEKDALEAKLSAERRRMAGKLAYEEAIIAKREEAEEKKRRVNEMKEEADKLMHVFMVKRLQDEERQRDKVKTVQETQQNVIDARRKVREYKASIVKRLSEEKKELMERALKEAELEMIKKMDLIREIRSLEAVPKRREKLVDLASTPGHGLLAEMSIIELRERLCLTRLQNEEEEKLKRDNILIAKQNKDQLLIETIDTISKHRDALSKSASCKFSEKTISKSAKHKQGSSTYIQDDSINTMQERLDELKTKRKSRYNNLGYGVDKKLSKPLPVGAKSNIRLEQSEKSIEKQDRKSGVNIFTKSAQRIATAGRQTALSAFS